MQKVIVAQKMSLKYTFHDVVNSHFLVGGNKARNVSCRSWLQLVHHGQQLLLELPVEHFGPDHGGGEVDAGDVPAIEHQVSRLYHGQQRVEWHVHIVAQGHGAALGDRAKQVGVANALLGVPAHLVLVGEQGSR